MYMLFVSVIYTKVKFLPWTIPVVNGNMIRYMIKFQHRQTFHSSYEYISSQTVIHILDTLGRLKYIPNFFY